MHSSTANETEGLSEYGVVTECLAYDVPGIWYRYSAFLPVAIPCHEFKSSIHVTLPDTKPSLLVLPATVLCVHVDASAL
jgi:hypothetical protein